MRSAIGEILALNNKHIQKNPVSRFRTYLRCLSDPIVVKSLIIEVSPLQYFWVLLILGMKFLNL